MTDRIEAVKVVAPGKLQIRWRDAKSSEVIDLSHWIASGGNMLASLLDPKAFAKATTSSYGAAVTWDDGQGDLSIDAVHLRRLALGKR